MEFERSSFQGADCKLSVVTFGPETGSPLVFVHGMRDHGLSLLHVAQAFPNHRVYLPDLRGHGNSDHPGQYGLVQFVADLKALFDQFSIDAAVLVGHSLGGHITLRFASLYPSRITHLIAMDGMGPPGVVGEAPGDFEHRMQQWHRAIDYQLQGTSGSKVMKGIDEAEQRLRSNNPQLSDELAGLIVQEGTREVDGGVIWRWDARVDMIWTTFSHAESELAHSAITCPVLLMTGDRGLDYWAVRRPQLATQTEFYEAELQRRTALFANGQHVLISNAGHMLHYDQPHLVANQIRAFIERL